MSTIFDPLPGGSVGRTDQGVDESAPPGTPVRAIATERVAGVIPNWFAGQPYEWFQILTGPLKGMYNYVAEQVSLATTRVGTVFQGGQQIGTVASSGTGLEFGFATASGDTLAHSTSGYVEGQATPAGRSYRNRVLGHASGASAGTQDLGNFTTTAYGPPWGGIEGGGQTETGIDLSSAPQRYIVAVDPSVIPLHSQLKINPNPFGDPNITFAAEDTGGAIKDKRIDFYDWRGRASQNSWGRRNARVTLLSGAGAGNAGVTRPGGDNSDAALQTAFADYYAPSGKGMPGGPTLDSAVGLSGSVFPIPDIPDPVSLFSDIEGAIGSTADFLKWVAWLFHPRNVLRVVEFLTGIGTLAFGLYIALASQKGSQTRREVRTVRRTGRRVRRVTRDIAAVALK